MLIKRAYNLAKWWACSIKKFSYICKQRYVIMKKNCPKYKILVLI